MKTWIFGFLFGMWILILIGGGIVVLILGPISVTGYGENDLLYSSIIKGAIAILLVIAWILILLKLKDWFFKKKIQS